MDIIYIIVSDKLFFGFDEKNSIQRYRSPKIKNNDFSNCTMDNNMFSIIFGAASPIFFPKNVKF